MTSKEAAEYLGYSDITLRISRSSGYLAGVPAPLYTKRGGRVIYEESDLIEWLSQFKKIQSTKDSSIEETETNS